MILYKLKDQKSKWLRIDFSQLGKDVKRLDRKFNRKACN